MKLVVVGMGQCGGRIADEFLRLNKRAKSKRGLEIVVDAFAVNTDTADLAGLTTIAANFKHRILIGAGKTQGHGVAKISEVGAEIAKEDELMLKLGIAPIKPQQQVNNEQVDEDINDDQKPEV